MMEDLGHDVIGLASEGIDAIEKIKVLNPDLVLLDIILKGNMDGIEIGQKIRDLYNIPFIYVTSYYDDRIIERAKITEPYGYLTKPFDNTEIQIAIERAIEKHKNQG